MPSSLSRIEEESGPAARNAARKCIGSFWVWAMQEGLADANPVVNTGRADERSRDRVLNSNELRTLWRALSDDDFGDIVRLLILTGQRREEIGGLLWLELELGAGKITLSPHRVKNGREHIVPLSHRPVRSSTPGGRTGATMYSGVAKADSQAGHGARSA